jgi:hypothetical protein
MSSLPDKRNSKVPQPFSFSPSANWEGNDGTWSTFIIRVGTPPQTFRVLISTAGQETWVPLAPQACLPTDPANCGDLRGAQTFQNAASAGFETNEVHLSTPVPTLTEADKTLVHNLGSNQFVWIGFGRKPWLQWERRIRLRYSRSPNSKQWRTNPRTSDSCW